MGAVTGGVARVGGLGIVGWCKFDDSVLVLSKTVVNREIIVEF